MEDQVYAGHERQTRIAPRHITSSRMRMTILLHCKWERDALTDSGPKDNRDSYTSSTRTHSNVFQSVRETYHEIIEDNIHSLLL